MDLNKVLGDDDCFNKIKQGEREVSYYSLRIALESYLSTYDAVRKRVRGVKTEEINKIDELAFESDKYRECVIKTWVFLQHFFEIELKRILERRSPELSIRIKDNNNLYCDYCLKKDFADTDQADVSVEFSDALKRVVYLVKKGEIESDVAKIVFDKQQVLLFINRMRNKLLHRGRSIIRYSVFDEVMSKSVLPLLKEYVLKENYINYNCMYGRSKKISELIEPLIQKDDSVIDLSKMAWHKEYILSELHVSRWFGGVYKKLLDNKIYEQNFMHGGFGGEIFKCPCCLENSWIQYIGFIDTITDELEEYEMDIPGVEEIKCANCGFVINDFVGDVKRFGVNDEIWKNAEYGV